MNYVFFNLRGRNVYLWRASTNHYFKRKRKGASTTIIFLVAISHLYLTLIALNSQVARSHIEDTPSLQMLYLSQVASVEPERLETPEIKLPSIKVSIAFHEVSFEEKAALDITPDNSSSNYQLVAPDSDKYQTVFDPKLRKKLIDLESLNRSRATTKHNASWTADDGRVYTYMGDGACLVTNLKTDWRDRGTSYTRVKCGKTDSEKMIDSIDADLDARRHPLKSFK